MDPLGTTRCIYRVPTILHVFCIWAVVEVALVMWGLDSEIVHETLNQTAPCDRSYVPESPRSRVVEWAYNNLAPGHYQ